MAKGSVRQGLAATVLSAVVLCGCGAVFDPAGYYDKAASTMPADPSQAAMLALSKADLIRAESYAAEALRRNPEDPYAMLVLATVYQNTGRTDQAIRYYKALLSRNPQQLALVGNGPDARQRPIAEIARAALASPALSPPAPPGGPVSATDDPAYREDGAVIARFVTLQQLYDSHLITREEYEARRSQNLGALLPYTGPQPAAGLTRSPPGPQDVVSRLKALATAYEDRGITAAEQEAERGAILEALLPLQPARRADLPPAITSDLQQARLLGRLQRQQGEKVITAEEAGREGQKIISSYAAYVERTTPRPVAGEISAPNMAPALPPASPELVRRNKPAVRLGSFASEAQASRAWAALQRQFAEALSPLQPVMTTARDKQGRKSVILNAAPLASKGEANGLCRILTRRHQSCAATTVPVPQPIEAPAPGGTGGSGSPAGDPHGS